MEKRLTICNNGICGFRCINAEHLTDAEILQKCGAIEYGGEVFRRNGKIDCVIYYKPIRKRTFKAVYERG